MNKLLPLSMVLQLLFVGLYTYGQDLSTQVIPTQLVPVTSSLVFTSGRFQFEIGSDAHPKSLKLSSGKEVLRNNFTNGLRLQIPNEEDLLFTKVFTSADNIVFATTNEQYYATFNIDAQSTYIAFNLVDFYGDLPLGATMTFTINTDEYTKLLSFDYMTLDQSTVSHLSISFEHLWERYKGNTLGGFALYTFSNEEEQDESILRAWGRELMPHPTVPGTWNYERAVQWIEEWKATFEDQSVFYIRPNNAQELPLFEPYFEMADVTTINMFTDVWHGGFWPSNTLNWEVNGIFNGKEELQAFSNTQAQNDRSINLHYVSGGIGKQDPLYAMDNLSDDLATWVEGTLHQGISENELVVYFKPKEAWYNAPSTLSQESNTFGHLSGPLPTFFHYKYLQIGDEMVQVNGIQTLPDGTWQFNIENRSIFNTPRSEHAKDTKVKGIILAYNQVYVPENNSALFDTITMKYAELLNDCKVSNALFDGAEIHVFDGKWGFRKFAQKVYEQVDHPIVVRTSNGKEPEAGYIEYQLNSTKAYLTSPVGDHNHGRPSLRLERKSTTHKNEVRESSNLFAANFMLSVQAAVNGRNFSILRPDPMFGISLEELTQYGKTEELLSLLPKWKNANKKLTAAQRQVMTSTHFKYENKWASEVTYELKELDQEYELVPIQMMSQHVDSIQDELEVEPALQYFHSKQEDGMYIPRVNTNFGATKYLENKYSTQAPQFIIRVMWGNEDVVHPSIHINGATLTVPTTILASATESQYIEYRGGDKAKIYDKNWNLTSEVDVDLQGTFEAQQGFNEVTLSSTNQSTAAIELFLFTEGTPLTVEKIQHASLQEITVNDIPLENFSQYTTEYQVNLPEGTVETPHIQATSYHAKDSIEIIPAENFYGTTIINVYSEDGSSMQTYKVKLNVLGRAFYKFDEGEYYPSLRGHTVTVTPNLDNPFPDETVAASTKVAKITRGPYQNALIAFDLNGQLDKTGEKVFRFKVYQASEQGAYPKRNNIYFSVKNRKNNGPKYEDFILITQQDQWVEYVFDFSDKDFTLTDYDELLIFFGGGDINETGGVEYYIADVEGPHINYSQDADLKSITINNEPLQGFDPNTLNYRITLPFGTANVPSITANKNSELASILLQEATSLQDTTHIQVTSEDGSLAKLYQLTFDIAKDPSNATLVDILLDDISITSFHPTTFEYTINLPIGTTNLPSLQVIPYNENATIEIITAKNFYDSSLITVTSEDGTATAYYWLHFDIPGREYYKFDGNTYPTSMHSGTTTITQNLTNPAGNNIVGSAVKVGKVVRQGVQNAVIVFNLDGDIDFSSDQLFRVKIYQASGQANYPRNNNLILKIMNKNNIGPSYDQRASITVQDEWVEYIFDFSNEDLSQTTYNKLLLFLGGGDIYETEGVEYYISAIDGPSLSSSTSNNRSIYSQSKEDFGLQIYKSSEHQLTVASDDTLKGKYIQVISSNGVLLYASTLKNTVEKIHIDQKGLMIVRVFDQELNVVEKVVF
ncbi:cadherin-like beta sandwich domain-containing protein [Flammeovirga agarivorans]|uniref:Cadherin-like beta sandwich domain-containing protein n=1 Tax=Flammeovirga agarivorans TaxID=2726742 RepID=A0A7X8XWA1_9BACT|nr:cadherin-like beta sandwich domain-containing protein [Flammeovirga agarivorans]NLR91880.1 cadherin-like beta sandwich domain-containing protein [Flammeovirga agarivorans]